MTYIGSKRAIAKDILPIILDGRKDGQFYIEPFCGGCNSMENVTGNRIANDFNKYLIAMFNALVWDNWKPPHINKVFYNSIRLNKDEYPDYLVGYAGFIYSFRGKWFGGYAGTSIQRDGGKRIRLYAEEQVKNLYMQLPKLVGVKFVSKDYRRMTIPDNSIIYCDPPYKQTMDYQYKFNHIFFWEWVRGLAISNQSVFVSEYQAPPDFKCVWEKEVVSHMRNDRKGNARTEKLFVYNP